jgi:hypothetical protein
MAGRTKLLLGVLGILLLLSGWFYLAADSDSSPAGGTGVAGAVARRPTAQEVKKPVEYVEELRVADLLGQARSFTPGRDPFRFFVPLPPPPPKPRQPTQAELDRLRQEQERLARERAAHDAAEAAKPKPPEPPEKFTMSYLGSFGPPEKRLAVFTDGKTIYNTQQGDVISGKFIVAHIGYESVDIQFVGRPEWPAQRLAVGRTSR